ncbi:MAG TPA: sigma-70 family RNA polymerase sigma factor, partial [Verrucomicrobiae bacterium]
MNDNELLTKFAETKSDAAFRALVDRYLPLVFGTARRITRDEALAEDIAQTVFLLLAQKARDLSRESVLSGWFFRTTRFVSLRALRSEHRRKNRERIAVTMSLDNASDPLWQRVSPELDEALACLSESDRRAVLLRFFEGATLARVGNSLGVSEEAAKKRVSRAVEKLREILSRRGVPVSAAALAAGLVHETHAAVPTGLANTISSSISASLAAGTGAAGGWLFVEVVRALQWARIKLAIGTAAMLAIAFFAVHFARKPRVEARGVLANANAENAQPTNSVSKAATAPALLDSIEVNGRVITLKAVRVTVLDAADERGIAGARVTAPLGTNVVVTDDRGVAIFQIPADLAEMREVTQIQAFVKADGYESRSIMWLSSTGGVLQTIGPEYTVRLAKGATIGGFVVNDSDQPIEDAKLRFIGNTYEGYSYSIGGDGKISSAPIVRAQDFSEFAPSSDVITDKRGHFSANDFPSDLKRLKVTVETPDGTPHSFGTEDHRLSTENLPPVSIRELRAGRARLKIAAGVDLSGIVVDANGIAVEGAAVVESVGNGNLRILSRKTTDARGAFHLPNQQEREVLLGASAEGHGSISTLVTISKGMEVVRLQLPMETPLVGRVTDQQGSPIADAHVGLIDYMNDGIGLEWGAETLADGRFVWTGAPTNELILYVTAEGYAPQLARAKAGPKEHVIRLQAGVRERLRFTGTVTDADTGEPIDQFTVMARDIEKWGSVLRPSYLRARAEGRKGEFSVELNLAELEIRSDVALGVVIDAEGYETALSERSFVQEGDRHFEIKMHRGGMIRGDVRSADGQMAPGATVVLTLVDSGAGLNQESGSFNGNFKTQADTQGHFEIQKQVTATYCAVSHDSGWALQKIPDGNETMNVTLQPWASVHIRFDRSTPRGVGSRVHL